jgi:hypothetical protein
MDMCKEKNIPCVRIACADLLKHIAKMYYGWDGQKDSKGRTLLQLLGTEKVRSVCSDFWIAELLNIVKYVFQEDYKFILIPDTRYPNEIELPKKHGFNVISVHVLRPNFDNGLTEEQKNHISETSLDNYNFDISISAENLFELENEVINKLGYLIEGEYNG